MPVYNINDLLKQANDLSKGHFTVNKMIVPEKFLFFFKRDTIKYRLNYESNTNIFTISNIAHDSVLFYLDGFIQGVEHYLEK